MKYIEPLFRPPGEADSLIFQVAYGCPHNQCRFCGMYKGVKYHLRSEEEVLAEISKAGIRYQNERRFFLADGDVMALSVQRLKRYLEAINTAFPRVARINSYANGSSILKYTQSELEELRRLRLNTLYIGLESGSQKILDLVTKGESAESMAKAVNVAQNLDFRCSVMILLGLGGEKYSQEHALETARILNKMQPRLLSALRFIEVPNTTMFDDYQTVSEYQAVVELLQIIEHLELERTVFRANHSSNPIPLEGRFPNDKGKLINYLENLLASGKLSKTDPGPLPLFL